MLQRTFLDIHLCSHVSSFTYITTFRCHFIFHEVYWEDNVRHWGLGRTIVQTELLNWLLHVNDAFENEGENKQLAKGLSTPPGASWWQMAHPKEQNSLPWKCRAVSTTLKPLLAVSLAVVTSSAWGDRRLRLRKILSLRPWRSGQDSASWNLTLSWG